MVLLLLIFILRLIQPVSVVVCYVLLHLTWILNILLELLIEWFVLTEILLYITLVVDVHHVAIESSFCDFLHFWVINLFDCISFEIYNFVKLGLKLLEQAKVEIKEALLDRFLIFAVLIAFKFPFLFFNLLLD